jgi:alkanesulfonate monooxygenase SsuD/methylene tetrahydromethanopterin reductase-like flavin-dependent oxidoreductase (luciferase family)
VRGAINQPKGVQKPHIPLLIGGGGEKVTLKLVAQYGDACNIGHLEPEATARKFEIMHKHCEKVGRDYHDINRTILLNCSIDEIDEQALERAQTANFARNTRGPEHLRTRGLIGTPEMIRQRLAEYEQSGAQEVILYFPAPERLESLRMFAREVMGK